MKFLVLRVFRKHADFVFFTLKQIRFYMPSASFQFGSNDEHNFRIVCGYFGKEQYFVNGKLIASFWSFRLHGIRSFNFQGHEIEVHVKVNMKGAFSEAFVDGELKATNLFSDFNSKLTRKRNEPSPFLQVAIWVVLALLFFIILQKVDAKSNTRHDTKTAYVSDSTFSISQPFVLRSHVTRSPDQLGFKAFQ